MAPMRWNRRPRARAADARPAAPDGDGIEHGQAEAGPPEGIGHGNGLALLRHPVSGARQLRNRTLLGSGLGVSALLVLALSVPVPYVAQQPGPTMDTLAEFDGKPMVEISGAPTYPTEGELRLTTVAVLGGPGHRMSAGGLLAGWFDPDAVILPIEQYYPPRASQQQIEERASLEMQSSQMGAAVAALESVGIPVPTTLTVDTIDPTSGAAGNLEDGDVLEAITVAGEYTEVVDFAALSDVLAATPPGTEVTLTVERGGESLDVPVTTGSRQARDAAAGLPVGEEPDGSVLGIGLVPAAVLPIGVEYQIDDVGGPSAGMMFALATIDKLTPGSLTGGRAIAGTGTIALDGKVGPIGGIRQKVVGAHGDGADFFLAPQANCAELTGYVPDGLRVVPVGTLEEARVATEAIGAGETAILDALPSCG